MRSINTLYGKVVSDVLHKDGCAKMRPLQSTLLFPCRAGATHVTGAEISQHMCDVAAETVVMNGYAAKCIMINKDVRRLHASKLPEGTVPDMEQKASLCIYEVPL